MVKEIEKDRNFVQQNRLLELLKEMFSLRMKRKLEQSFQVSRLKSIRREIARIKGMASKK